jgi:hypothetical protein
MGVVTEVQRGDFRFLGKGGRGDQVVAEAYAGVGAAVVLHERCCPPGDLLGHLEALHAAAVAWPRGARAGASRRRSRSGLPR